ncbi:MAG: LuxR C-terminal-related transcriptional regulator [Treponema sp.]|jgi:LuxR family maltose regulon positive regulatory protein|nr:LuxR C-terminal-related transcriptional regulator [Treponema sp.]
MPGNQAYLERPQIHRLLEGAVQSPLVTVVAGAGYGKSHAVYSFVHACKAITSWIQLSEFDNNGNRFWENFTQAVGAISRESGEKLIQIGLPRTERQFDRYFAVPRSDVISGVKYLFVYDDFHLLRDPAVLHFLERTITVPFKNITSIIISRTGPSINLMGLLSKGLLAQITQDELRFSPREMTDYYSLQGIRLKGEDLEALYQETEGWAFAIRLAGFSLKNGAAGDYGRSLMRFNVFKLIESEVFSGISPGLQRLLIKLSLIDRLPLDLVRELAEDPVLPGEMEKAGAFITFDPYLNAYRIHHLFLAYLKGRQNCLSGEEKREVYNRAGRWCAENDFKMDALNYYEKAGDYSRITALVYTMPMLIPDSLAESLLEIFERAPERLFMEQVTAYMIYTRLFILLGRFEEADLRLREVIEKFETPPVTDFGRQVLYRCYLNMGFFRLLTCVFTREYDFDLWMEKVLRFHGAGETLPFYNMMVASYACRVGCRERGEIEKYIAAVSRGVACLEVFLGGCAGGMDDLARGELAFFRDSLDEAERFCYQALRRAQSRRQYEIENRALFYLLRIRLAQGAPEKVPEILKQLEAQLTERAYYNRYTFYDIITGWFYAHLGLTGKPAPWLKSDFEESDLNSLNHGLETLVKAKLQFAERRYPAAMATLETIRVTRFGAGVFLLGKIERAVLDAVCRSQTGDQAGAFLALGEAYELAEPNGLWMPFIELGRDMRALAGAALKEEGTTIPRPRLEKIQRSAASYGKKYFAAVEQFRGPEKEAEDGSALSPRELEVLAGLAQGFTREEIAADSDISVNTVKSVIRSVYNKLGALNRADAMRIAASRGLLKGL